jgi:hypothetical protein
VISHGVLLAKLQLSNRGGLVIGVRTPSGEEILNPTKEHAIEPGTVLIHLAEAPLLDPPT